ncbi:DMKN isoform 63 [Pongo abelii]|uniref:DMKN isoform 63 n=1 Tax=Pongo abelii TaxID=9601 RepID=A0A2J8RRM9_PONAB|nr:DMKN isoform 63 [Pongo abelii]
MKFQGSLACLLLALCLGSGEAGPLQSEGESTGTNTGEAIGHGMGDALSQGVGQAVGKEAGGKAGSKVNEALGQGTREAVSTGVRQVPGFGPADALGNRVGEAAHALGNTGHEIRRQAEDVIRHRADAVQGSWQGVPGHNGAWETSGGHGIFGSQGGLGGQGQGNPGGLVTPWVHGYPGNSAGSFGTNPQGAPWGQGGNGGPPNFGTNTQGAVAQPGYGSVRGSNQNEGCTNPPPSGSGGGSSNSGGGSGSQSGSSGSGSNGDNNGSSSGGSSSGNSSGSSSGGSSGNSGGSSSGNSGGSSSSNNGGSRGDSGSESSWDRGYCAAGLQGFPPPVCGGQPLRFSKSLHSSEYPRPHLAFSMLRITSCSDQQAKEGEVLEGSSTGSSSGNHGGSGGGNGHKPGCEKPGNEARGTGESGIQGFRGQGVSNNMRNSETSPGMFNFDTFWKNFKSKLGFINWDAINKDQRSSRIP